MSRITTRRFALWWSLAQTWLNNKFGSITIDTSTLATETNATANRTALANAIAALQGSNASATLSAIYTIVGAITSGLTDLDKAWLLQQFAAIDLSAITSRLDNSTYGLNALKTAISSITFDKSDLAKEATLGTANDTASNATIFGKIANLLSTWNTWISGAWATLVSNVTAIKAKTDNIGTPSDTSSASTLFGKVAAIPTTQPTDYAKQGSNPDINFTTLNAKMDTVIGTGITEITTQAITEIVNRVITEDSESE